MKKKKKKKKQGRSQLQSPGLARVPLSSFFLKSRSIFLTFPQTLLIFSPTREGPGYATETTTTTTTTTLQKELKRFPFLKMLIKVYLTVFSH